MAASRLGPQQRTALLSVLAAAGLVALKLTTGLISGSLGLIAEALHSATDLVAALLTFLALGVAGRPPDREHPFGHGKAEHLAALGEAAFLVCVSVFIGVRSIDRLVSGGPGPHASLVVIAVVVVVIAIDAARALVSWRASRRHHSPALASNALHFATDMLGSLAVLVGLAAARAGHPGADAIAALVVGVLVIGAAANLMRQNVHVLMDRSPEDAELRVRGAIARAEPGVAVRRVRVREAAGRFFVDLTIAVEPDQALGQSHAVADAVEQAVHAGLPGSDVVVHVEPGETRGTLRERATGAALTVRGVREVHNVEVAFVEGRRELSLHLKLPSGMALEEAHEIASNVERAIGDAVPEIDAVHTHIEPLAPEHVEQRMAGGDETASRRGIEEIVRRHTGQPALEIRLRRGEDGLLAYITATLPRSRTVAEAHEVAMDVEREVNALPFVADAVVHTEPASDRTLI